MRVIAISGHAQNGKDTIAKIMQRVLAEQWMTSRVIHYADLLKFVCKTYFDWDGKKDEFGRSLLQYVGTDIVRAENPNFWVDFVASMLKFFGDRWDYVLIPDARFQNEIERLREHGFDVTHIRVDRDAKSSLTEKQLKHASETSLDNVMADFYINNNGSLEDLETTVKIWMEENCYAL